MTSRLPRLYVGRHHQHQLRRRQAKEEGGEGKGGEGTKKNAPEGQREFCGPAEGGKGRCQLKRKNGGDAGGGRGTHLSARNGRRDERDEEAHRRADEAPAEREQPIRAPPPSSACTPTTTHFTPAGTHLSHRESISHRQGRTSPTVKARTTQAPPAPPCPRPRRGGACTPTPRPRCRTARTGCRCWW